MGMLPFAQLLTQVNFIFSWVGWQRTILDQQVLCSFPAIFFQVRKYDLERAEFEPGSFLFRLQLL